MCDTSLFASLFSLSDRHQPKLKEHALLIIIFSLQNLHVFFLEIVRVRENIIGLNFTHLEQMKIEQ